jgi:nicotinate phosphoribosyltransferase
MKHAQIVPDRLALSTDLYELTMAAGYFAEGVHDRTATFDLGVRSLPPHRGFLLVAGLEQALAYLDDFRFNAEGLAYLERTGHFHSDFLDYLAELRFTGDVDAIPEGTLAFPPSPIMRITAPIIEAQIIETFLLTTITFQTMIATKAARVVHAADGRQVVDFSARRDHGPQAGLLAARASFIGGCVGTSNVLAGSRFGIPTYGTMAHSFIMFHTDEEAAFDAFADAYPGDPTLLIDTYDTIEGARKAVHAAKRLAAEGRRLAAVRLDSGDLVALSRGVRKVLDGAGLQDTRIFASGGLDEYEISRLLSEGAELDAFGVGTELGTSGDAPSLDSTYKLVACHDAAGTDVPVMKLSTGKATLPGRKQVWRYHERGRFAGDVIGLDGERPSPPTEAPTASLVEALLHPVVRGGAVVERLPSLKELQQRAAAQLEALAPDVKRLRDPQSYPIEITQPLLELTNELQER